MLRIIEKSFDKMIKIRTNPSTFAINLQNQNRQNVVTLQRNYCDVQVQRQPVQPLRVTLDRFLKTAEPFLSPQEYESTRNIVADFEKNDGADLQKVLERRAGGKSDWLAEWWIQYGYLLFREPLPIYSTPGLVYPNYPIQNVDDQVNFAAKFIYNALQYKKLVDNEKLEQQKMGKQLLDMSQYYKIFGTNRVPKIPQDEVEFHPDSKHIILFYMNHIFKIPVFGSSTPEILSENELKKQIQDCIKSVKEPGHPLGILTTEHRDRWSKAYSILTRDSKNLEAVKIIEGSIFCISIDQRMSNEDTKNPWNTAAHQALHGGGSVNNSGNRWFDKCLQVFVGATGQNAAIQEHSPAEGQPTAVMSDMILKALHGKKNESEPAQKDVGLYEKSSQLQFKFTPELLECIEEAKKNIDKLSGNLDMEVLHYKNYGRNQIKKFKMSPDSFIQMAIQYAFYRLHKTPGAHYESAHLRMYEHGRTETIRSCSNESVAFAKAMVENRSDDERRRLLIEAVNGHRKYTNSALAGQGVDRHLFALKVIALQTGLPIHKLYSDPGYTRSLHMRLSTSQVASAYESFMCYGPLVEDGYGCCYNPRENDMFFACSSLKSCKDTSAKTFALTLGECFTEMKSLLDKFASNDNNLKSKL